MATITSATGGMVSPSSSDLQSTITSLLSSVNTGQVVTADQINSIVSLYNSFLNHYHGISDLYGIFNYGDGLGTPYSSAGDYEADSTSGPTTTYGTLTGVSAGDSITASKHNEMANYINGIQGHYHTWDDRTG
jgi:hypothetical protein